jgi:putative redox protein
MTVRLYAERKGWPLDRVEVRLQHDKIYAEDCADCETREGFLDRITKQLTLEGDLDAEQRQRLAEIGERCPVQRTLQREVVITQELTPVEA